MPDVFARRITLLTAITDVMGELGLEVPTGVVGNPELTVNQFYRLANRAGQKIALDPYKWSFLSREYTLTTVIGNPGPYPLPPDFSGFVNDAGWNRTSRLPVVGALEEYEWQMLQARLLAGTAFTMLYVITEAGVLFYNTPQSIETIVMPYNGRGWCTTSDGLSYQDSLLDDTDIILFEPQLFKCAIRLEWQRTKQFDTAIVQAEFNQLLAAAKAIDKPGRTLALTQKRDFPYLGAINMPDTGYGS